MTGTEIDLDHSRRERIGLEEAIFAAGRSTTQLIEILTTIQHRGGRSLLTRLTATEFARLPLVWCEQIDYDPVSQTGYYGALPLATEPARVAVVSAGTSDAPVAIEVVRTLQYAGHGCERIFDVGVAGL